MQNKTTSSYGAMSTGIALQLFVSCVLVGSVTPGINSLLLHNGLVAPLALLIAAGVGGLLGLLLTANIQYSLWLLALTLARFARGLPVEALHTIWRWPLTALFEHLNTFNQQIKDVEGNKRLTSEFREQLLRQASETAAAEERNRIARDLHDSIKQQIFSISISAAAAKAHWNAHTEEAQAALEDIRTSAREAQTEMQALLQQLRSSPLENTSLPDALRNQIEALGYRTGAQVHIAIDELPASDLLPPHAQETIFRIVQETFANIARHARAHTVWLKLYQHDHAFHVEVRDDGQGFVPATAQKGMGLANLHERAKSLRGTAELQSAPGQGTSIHVTIPLLQTPQDALEAEHSTRESKKAIEQARQSFQLSENIAWLMIVMIIASLLLLDASIRIPLFILIACLVFVFFGYAQGYYYTTRVTLALGRESLEAHSLRLRASAIRLQVLRILTPGIWYVFIIQQVWTLPYALLIALLLSFLFTILLLIICITRSPLKMNYYALLSPEELEWELQEEKQRIYRRLRTWLVACGIEAIIILRILLAASTALSPNTTNGWINYGVLIALTGGVMALIADALQLKRGQSHLATRSGETQSGEQKTHTLYDDHIGYPDKSG